MPLTQGQVARYHRDGYLIVENVLTPREVELLRAQVNIADPASGFTDASGKTSRLSFWGDTHSTIWGAASTCPRIINAIRILTGEEVTFFHGKVTLKEAGTGGAWEWHQDFGYWYDQGYIFPRMMSVSVALDANDEANGCLRVLRGSHLMGRMTHGRIANQTGADMERLTKMMPFFEEVPAVMPPGAALFFHCNTLHASGQNTSDRHRRNFIACYYASANPQIGGPPPAQRVPCPVGAEDVIERYAAEHNLVPVPAA
ncbi:MAG: phytanoyl-CoA dioxygenase family protein [Planctomycetes bacterium]|nr:phytanoyl-CoA dioxygenase family protein [Planctomycetota bacterium]